jgi:membrane-associated phospholipid phosphatase
MTDPLHTRSLPGALWERVPEGLVALDEAVAESVSTSFERHPNLRFAVEFLTEKPLGWMILAILTTLILWRILNRSAISLVSRRRWVTFVLSLVCVLLVSDFCSTQLKIMFGRLKPHVNFYNPHFLPALSFPSNHSFNTACLLVFLYTLSRPLVSPMFRPYFWQACFVFWIGIAASRVALGEHYPIDVLMGGLLGSTLGLCLAQLALKVERFSGTEIQNSTK